MAYIPDSGSVAAWLQSDNASVMTVIVGGSIAATFTPPANQSVSGTIAANIQGSVATVIIGGSIAATFTPPANQSVSGTVQAQIQASVAAVIIGGSIAASFTPPDNQSVSGTVVTIFESSSIIAVATGSVITVPSGSVITVLKSSSVVAVVTGSVALASSVITVSIGSVISYIQNSVAAVIIGGSVAAGTQYLENDQDPSVIGTALMFKSNMTTSILSVVTPLTPLPVSVQGTVTALQGTTPWLTNQGGSVIVVLQSSSLITREASSSIIAVVTGSVALASSVISVPIGSVIVVLQSSSIITREASSSIIAVVTGSVALASSVISVPIGSTIAYIQNSVAAVIIGGSIIATVGTQYLENQIDASVTGTAVMFKSNISSSILTVVTPATPLPVSVQGVVTALQGTTPWLTNQGGSIIAVFQSSSLITREASSSIIAVVTGSVALASSVITVPTGSTISYIQNSIAAIIIGGSIATATTNSSVLLLNSANVIGSVATLQGTNPWQVNHTGIGSIYTVSLGSIITVNQSSSIIAVITGSVVAIGGTSSVIVAWKGGLIPTAASILLGVTANTNGSVLTTTGYPTALLQITSGPGPSITGQLNFEGTLDGTAFVPIQGYNLSTNVIASATGIEGDWAFNVAGLQGMRARVGNWTVGSITARAVTSPMDARPLATLNAGGSIATLQGTNPWLVSFGNSSIFTNQTGSIIAVIQGSSIIAINAGSVFTTSLGSIITVFQNSSLIAINAGSVFTVSLGSIITIQQANSIVGTYAEDAAHTSADKGIFVFGVRNDAVASFTSANLEYTPLGVDSAGRNITKPFSAEESRVEGYHSVVSTSVTTLVAAAGAGLRNYITDIILVNTGATTTLVTFKSGGGSSILGYGIAPSGGGSNMIGLATPMRTEANTTFDFQPATATSVLYATVKGYKAP